MTQLLQLQKTEVLKLNSSSCKIQTLDLWDHGRCSTLTNWAYRGFQEIGMIDQGQKSKPKKSQGLQTNPPPPPKIPGSKFNPRKIPCMPNFRAIKISRTQRKKQLCFYFNHGSITRELSRIFRLFWIPKKICSLIKLPEKILNKIFLPKKIQKSKISNPKKSLDHPCHLKSGLSPLGSG